jgi:RNA polymerase sigma factor (sigma-70 family)
VDPDLLLLQRWRDGDAGSGNTLFNRHFASIRRFFRNKVSAGDVEDLIQRTFLACVESRDRFRGDSTFRTYLFVVARNELYRHLRRRARDDAREAVDFGVSSIHAMGISPTGLVAKKEEHQLVLEALRRISVEYQLVIELYYWEQIPGPELAEILGVAPTTVRTRLFRAREALREQMEKLGDTQRKIDMEQSVRALQHEI